MVESRDFIDVVYSHRVFGSRQCEKRNTSHSSSEFISILLSSEQIVRSFSSVYSLTEQNQTCVFQSIDSKENIFHRIIGGNDDEFFPFHFPDAVIKSTPFYLISAGILVVSYMILMIAMCSQRHSILFFFSGILFIIAGEMLIVQCPFILSSSVRIELI